MRQKNPKSDQKIKKEKEKEKKDGVTSVERPYNTYDIFDMIHKP